MWEGRNDTRDFDVYYDQEDRRGLIVRHIPSGMTLDDLQNQGIGDNSRNYLFSSGPAATWSVIVPVRWQLQSVRAKHLHEPWSNHNERELFRRRHGQQFLVRELVSVAKSPSIPWDDRLVETLITMVFLFEDFRGFEAGRPPYPDEMDFHPAQLPPSLHRKVVNSRGAQ